MTGQLLVAVPREGAQADAEDVFRRSVVLVLHHGDDGTHGLVLNHPLEAPVDSVLPTWQPHVSAPSRIFQGGPVALDTAMGLVRMPGDGDSIGIKRLFGGVALVDLDAPPPVVTPEISALRIFAGYSGWSGGQLEQELRVGHWFVVDQQIDDIFTEDPGTLWERVLRRQRTSVVFAVTFPADPSMN